MARRLFYILLCAIICKQSLYAQQAKQFDNPIIIKAPLLQIKYQISDSAKNHKTIVLWYRHIDKNNPANWKLGGTFKISEPIKFLAEKEGIYEFKLTFDKNAPPTDNEKDTYSVLVDTAKPLLQIKDVKFSNEQAIVRWHAFDENFGERPIEIYQIIPNAQQKFLGKFPNTGIAVISLDNVKTSKLKLIATDLAGNYTIAFSKQIIQPKVKKNSDIMQLSNPDAKTHNISQSSQGTNSINKNDPIEQPEKQVNAPQKEKITQNGRQLVFPKPSKQALNQFKIAKNYLTRGQIDFAKPYLLKALKLSPDFLDAKVELANILMSQGKYSQAENYFLQVIQLDAHNIKSLEALAKLNMRQGKYSQAKLYLKTILKKDKENITAMLKLGDIYWLTGDRTQAESTWKHAKEIIDKRKFKKFENSVNSRLELVHSRQ